MLETGFVLSVGGLQRQFWDQEVLSFFVGPGCGSCFQIGLCAEGGQFFELVEKCNFPKKGTPKKTQKYRSPS